MNANLWKNLRKIFFKNIQLTSNLLIQITIHTVSNFSHLVEFDSPWPIGHLFKIDFPDPDSLSLNLAI